LNNDDERYNLIRKRVGKNLSGDHLARKMIIDGVTKYIRHLTSDGKGMVYGGILIDS
jgi:hypothetical protein